MASNTAHTLKVSALALAGLAGTALAAVAIGPDPVAAPVQASAQAPRAACSGSASCAGSASACSDATVAGAPGAVQFASFDPDTLPSAGGAGGMVVVESIGTTDPTAHSAQSSNVTAVISRDDGTSKVKIEIRDGKVSAWVNGKEVPANRIKKSDSTIKVLDEKGIEVASFDYKSTNKGTVVYGNNVVLGSGAHDVTAIQTIPHIALAPSAIASTSPRIATRGVGGVSQVTTGWDSDPEDAPPVMIGITMGDVSPEILEFLGLESGSTFMINGVIDGLPADKAGVKNRDIVIKVDDKSPVSQDGLRKALRSKEPGDTVTLTVIRRGETKNIKVKLDKYDNSRLGFQTGAGTTSPDIVNRFTVAPPVPAAPPTWIGGAQTAPTNPLAIDIPTPTRVRVAPRANVGGRTFTLPHNEQSADVKKTLKEAVQLLREMKSSGDESAGASLKGFEEALRAIEKAASALDGLEVSGEFSIDFDDQDEGWKFFMGNKPDMIFRVGPGGGSGQSWLGSGDDKKAMEKALTLQGKADGDEFHFFGPEHAEKLEEELAERFAHWEEKFEHEHVEKLHEHLAGLHGRLEVLDNLKLADDLAVTLNGKALELAEAAKINGKYVLDLQLMGEKLESQNKNLNKAIEMIEVEKTREHGADSKSIKSKLDAIEDDLADIKRMLKQLMDMHKQ